MEIKLNTNRVPQQGYSAPVTQTGNASAATDTASISGATSLAARMNDIPLTRPEYVSRAQSLLSHPQYPPDDILDRISVLLAINLNR